MPVGSIGFTDIHKYKSGLPFCRFSQLCLDPSKLRLQTPGVASKMEKSKGIPEHPSNVQRLVEPIRGTASNCSAALAPKAFNDIGPL